MDVSGKLYDPGRLTHGGRGWKPLPIEQETWSAPVPVWTLRKREKSLTLPRILDHPNRSTVTMPTELHGPHRSISTLKANRGVQDVYTLPLLYYVKKDRVQQTLFCFTHFVPTAPTFVFVFFVFVRKAVGFLLLQP